MFFVGLLLIVAGVATGLLVVNTLNDSSKSTTSGTVTTFDPTTVKTVTVQQTQPATVTVTTPDDQTVTVKVDSITSAYCKTSPQVCASIEDDVLQTLSTGQQSAISLAKELCKSAPAKCGGLSKSQSSKPPAQRVPTRTPQLPSRSSGGSAGGGSGGVSSP